MLITGLIVFAASVLAIYATLTVGMWYGAQQERRRIAGNVEALQHSINDLRKIAVLRDAFRWATLENLSDHDITNFGVRHRITKETIARRYGDIEVYDGA